MLIGGSFNPCDDGLVFLTFEVFNTMNFFLGFNPCYDGLVFLTMSAFLYKHVVDCFNPCYDGLVFLTESSVTLTDYAAEFQSLL